MIAALLAGAGCGDSGPREVPAVEVCDGSDDIVLSAAAEPGRFIVDERLAENGARFLYITGDCRAFVSGDDYVLGDSYEITLTASQATEVGVIVGLGLWPERYGDHYSSDVADGHSTFFLDRGGLVRCYPWCNNFDDDVLRTMDLRAAIALVRNLGATPLTGSARILVTTSDQPDDVPTWPDELPRLADLARQPGEVRPPSDLLDGDAANAIRAFLASNMDFHRQTFEQDGQKYGVYFRDALPIENEDGLVIPEWPEPGPL